MQASFLIDDLPAQHISRNSPSTRYQGSKLKLLDWIWEHLKDLPFQSALDAFGGTGSVSYLLKSKNKAVTYNDYLRFNHIIGKAIIENQSTILSEDDLNIILYKHNNVVYDDFIYRTYHDVYYIDEENRWLDIVIQNITRIDNPWKQSLAYFALFQACIIKRPYNLFHRKNLYMRMQEVERSFGNKATWDTSFEEHFRFFVNEVNRAVFDSGVRCASLCSDALDVSNTFDLVYIDTPYLNNKGVGVDYAEFYHFLEGLTDYSSWPGRINHKKKHLPLKIEPSLWSNKKTITQAFDALFSKYQDSILVVSYRSDGIPSESALIDLVRKYKRDVRVVHYGSYKYALSTNSSSKELLIIGL